MSAGPAVRAGGAPPGIDFGTTNSAVARVGADGAPVLARFARAGGETAAWRSIVYFPPDRKDPRGRPVPHTGPEAIERYLAADGQGRLIQSMKAHLASRGFTSTLVFGRTVTLEELIAHVVRDLCRAAEAQLGPLGRRVVVGRPVRFARAVDAADDAFALGRLEAAIAAAGFDEVVFEHEPVAAAWHYERGLDHDELVLIGDFGGGTSDFSLLRLGPGARRERAGGRPRVLGTEGVALAGDAFDSRVIRHAVAPHLGRGSRYRGVFGDRWMPVPPWLYEHLDRWHHLSFLKSPETLRLLRDVQARAEAPARLEALIHLVEDDLGYHLYRAVEGTKVELSGRDRSAFRFRDPPIDIREAVERTTFEGWIAGELAEIAACVDRLLAGAGAASGDVDRVFLTGGSSLVPAVRRVFEARFGAERIRSGDELTSVASGLALRAAEVDA